MLFCLLRVHSVAPRLRAIAFSFQKQSHGGTEPPRIRGEQQMLSFLLRVNSVPPRLRANAF